MIAHELLDSLKFLVGRGNEELRAATEGGSVVSNEDYICPVGWWKRENRCYRFASGSSLTRDDAVALCGGSQLFVPSSDEEFQAVKEFINNHEPFPRPNSTDIPVWSAWIGCNDEVTDNVFECVDGTQFTPASTSSWWYFAEPDNEGSPGSGPVNCVQYAVWANGLFDTGCNDFIQPLCEAPAVKRKRSNMYSLTRSPDGRLVKGWCLANHTHRTISSDSNTHCASICMTDEACSSFNHHA
ncbi:uncharacterized protein [Diadema antillarum]|uniref:uncharacterized protein n=1 Tax=Diadema antillarum TaxID=105358 RepID=UPI003A87899F